MRFVLCLAAAAVVLSTVAGAANDQAVSRPAESADASASPVGIPRELAVARAANIADVRYRLQYALVPHAPSTTGREALTFHLDSATNLW
ncbi:MAG: hypothetical protein ACYC6M_12265, partial [Terriglobales bacterium]